MLCTSDENGKYKTEKYGERANTLEGSWKFKLHRSVFQQMEAEMLITYVASKLFCRTFTNSLYLPFDILLNLSPKLV